MKTHDNWRPFSLEELSDGGIANGVFKQRTSFGRGVPLINVMDTYRSLRVSSNALERVEVSESELRRFSALPGDLFFVRSSLKKEGIGNCCILLHTDEPCVFDCHLMRLRPNGEKVVPEFLALATTSQRFRADIISASGTTTMTTLSQDQLGSVRVVLPPLPEQRKIADILTTWDEALTQLDALIEAQERRKKALMQQLLTGHRRLKGFSKAWKDKRMDAVFERVDRAIEGEPEHVLSITAGRGFVDQREKFSRVIAGRNIENYVLLKKGEFSYNKGNSDRYPQGCVYRLEEFEEGAVPNVWISFRLRSQSDSPLFYKHFFLYGGLNHGLHRLINAGVRNDGLLNLTASNFFSVTVPTPEPEEQTKLGDLFENLSIFIKNLRDQRVALDQQKRGLMQRLLTGKIRVQP
jgi:type I restriction enzyme S subunit